MQVNVSTRHGHLAPQTQDRISAKVEKLKRFYDRITSIDITVDLQKEDSPDVEVRVCAEQADDFVATAQGDLIGALESCVQKLEQQLRKYKEKHSSHNRSESIRHMEVPEVEVPEAE